MKFHKLELGEIKLVGISTKTKNSLEMDPETAKIGETLGRYHGEGIADKIKARKNPGVTYCVYTAFESDENGPYTYFVGEEVESFDNQDPDLQNLTIMASSYNKYNIGPGIMPQICIDAWMKIWQMKKQDFGGTRSFLADFEIYDERSIDPTKAVFDIYIGIKDSS